VALEAGGRLPEAAGQVRVTVECAGGDGDVGAVGGEPLGERGADAAAGAGDERSPPGEPLHAR
jgi:hypothetical protein